MVDWKEQEHEDVDTQAMNDPNFLEALRTCRILKFFLTLGMQAQPDLLRYLISLWDINQEIFVISDHELELTTLDIYFVTRLSHRGEPVNLYGSCPIGASISSLLAEHFHEGLKSKSGKIKISNVRDLTLRVLLLTINRVARSQVEHETNKSNFLYAINYTAPTIFNQTEAMKMNIKHQFSRAKVGNLKKFAFGFVLVTFFLE